MKIYTVLYFLDSDRKDLQFWGCTDSLSKAKSKVDSLKGDLYAYVLETILNEFVGINIYTK